MPCNASACIAWTPVAATSGANVLVWLIAALAVPLAAQGPASLSGIVTDSTGAPLFGVSVSVNGGSLVTATDESGNFRLSGIPSGSITLKARRLGFVPVERSVEAAPGQSIDNLELRMAPAPRTLSDVVIKSNYSQYNGRLAGYYRRLERKSAGYFISRDEIDRKNYRSLSQLLRNVPGVNSVALIPGGNGIRMRGRSCRPLVWIDGVPMPAGEVDLDAFPTSTLHGIELYLGSTDAPSDLQVNGTMSNCGTIALWSRGSDTEAPRTPRGDVPDLAQLIASLRVFSADQVDKPAVIASPEAMDLKYPPELLSKNVGGSVLAEFVVDTTGKVERETVNLISSTDPLFSIAVLRSLKDARYVPAVKEGRPVRQVVHQPYSFVPAGRKSADRR